VKRGYSEAKGDFFKKLCLTILRSTILRGRFSDLIPPLIGHHHEQKPDDLCHEIETMIHNVFSKDESTLVIPVSALPGGAEGILVKPGAVFSRPPRVSFRNV